MDGLEQLDEEMLMKDSEGQKEVRRREKLEREIIQVKEEGRREKND